MIGLLKPIIAPYLLPIKLAAAVAVVGAIGWGIWQVRQSGFDAATTQVEKDNQDAISDANLAALSADDCLAARAGGQRVRFDFDTGKCVRSGAGGGSE